jgi:hypothetical protein
MSPPADASATGERLSRQDLQVCTEEFAKQFADDRIRLQAEISLNVLRVRYVQYTSHRNIICSLFSWRLPAGRSREARFLWSTLTGPKRFRLVTMRAITGVFRRIVIGAFVHWLLIICTLAEFPADLQITLLDLTKFIYSTMQGTWC